MKLQEIYEFAVRTGIEADPRPRKEIDSLLKEAKEKYDKMSKEEKEVFDTELFANPYSDTRILAGTGREEIKTIIVGVDMEVGEVLLADRLNQKGEKIDLIMSHHPEGKALANLSDVMKMQADLWYKFGVPINIGEALISPRMKEVFRRLSPINHSRAVDAARLLGFPFLSVHTPADNLVTKYLTEKLDKEKPRTLKNILEILKEIPEYKEASMNGAGPTIFNGDESSRAGKIMVDMTGGTEGPKEIIEKLSNAGVGTLVSMHMDDKLKSEAEKHKINVVIAGHISSDAIGINLFLDKLSKKDIKAITCSGLTRVKR